MPVPQMLTLVMAGVEAKSLLQSYIRQMLRMNSRTAIRVMASSIRLNKMMKTDISRNNAQSGSVALKSSHCTSSSRQTPDVCGRMVVVRFLDKA